MKTSEILGLMSRVLEQYQLSPLGIHGVGHWERVLENGRRIAEFTGADVDVVELFAIFHDARRIDDGYDPEHGQRGGALACELAGIAFSLEPPRLRQLVIACDKHTSQRTHDDVTIATCWDADRLDLGRCGTQPHRSKLAVLFDRVEESASQDLVKWADGRAAFQVLPHWLQESAVI